MSVTQLTIARSDGEAFRQPVSGDIGPQYWLLGFIVAGHDATRRNSYEGSAETSAAASSLTTLRNDESESGRSSESRSSTG